MNKKEKIERTANCLLGICDDWDYFDIEQFLDWQLDNLENLAAGYPKEVMVRENEIEILREVERLLNTRNK